MDLGAPNPQKKSACGYFFKISTCFFTCVISFPPPTNSCKSPSNKKTLPLARRRRKILRVLRRFGTIFQRNLTFQSTKPSKILPTALFCFLICLRVFFKGFFCFRISFFPSYTPARPGKKTSALTVFARIISLADSFHTHDLVCNLSSHFHRRLPPSGPRRVDSARAT